MNGKRPENSGVPNRTLLKRHSNGDAGAFPELVSQLRTHVFSYLVYCGVDPASRDDLFQEIFLSVHRNAASYDELQPLEPWIFTIVANKVRSYFRSHKSNRLVYDEKAPEIAGGQCLHDLAVASETATWLGESIQELPLDQRESVILCCVRGLEQGEVARILDIPVNTVKTHVHRARLTLARALVARNARLKREVSHD